MNSNRQQSNYSIFDEMESWPNSFPYKKSFVDDILRKFISMLEQFLQIPSLDWIFRPTDDVFINPDGWPDRILNTLMDYPGPRSTFYLLGDCRAKDQEYFIHGGSGQILSRKAAEIFYSSRHELLRTRDDKWEDWILPQFANKILSVSPNTFFFPNIIGYSFPKSIYDEVIKDNWTLLPLCPKSIAPIGCVPGFQKLHNTIVMHQYWTRDQSMINEMKFIINNAPPQVMWYHDINGIQICLMNENTKLLT